MTKVARICLTWFLSDIEQGLCESIQRPSSLRIVSVPRQLRGPPRDDPDHSAHEDRFLFLGLSSSLRLLVVAHCYREAGGVIRIISACEATRGDNASIHR